MHMHATQSRVQLFLIHPQTDISIQDSTHEYGSALFQVGFYFSIPSILGSFRLCYQLFGYPYQEVGGGLIQIHPSHRELVQTVSTNAYTTDELTVSTNAYTTYELTVIVNGIFNHYGIRGNRFNRGGVDKMLISTCGI